MNFFRLFYSQKSLPGFFAIALLLFVFGAASAYAMAPTHYWPLLFAGLGLLYFFAANSGKSRKAFFYGWAFGFGYFVFSLSWIGNALLVEGNDYAWAWPLAVAALPACLAFFPALACFFSVKLFDLKHWHGWLGFCAGLGLFEWLRGHIFTGFPWNLFGYAWGDILPLLQILYWSDVYSLTLFSILLFTLPGFYFVSAHKKPAVICSLITVLIFAAFYGYGFHRLSVASSDAGASEDVLVKLVQPNIPQHEKWDPQKIAGNFEKTVEMSFARGNTNPDQTTLVIWPETALHFAFLNDRGTRSYLKQMLQSYTGPAYLIAGALLKDPEQDTYTNSIITLDQNGDLLHQYDKFHLVPFGEYIPFQNWIPLETVTRFSGFEKGSGPQSFALPNSDLKFSPLVCYEITFPNNVLDARNRPDFIINLTNDAWYGDSAGPHQHLLQARYRAIEEGLPVIRAANTGISAVFSFAGKTIIQTELFNVSAISTGMPQRGNNQYSHLKYILNNYVFYFIILSFLSTALFMRLKNTRFRK